MFYTPNEESWVGFQATLTGTIQSPKVADITGAVDLTGLIMGITASSTGQAVPTPTFKSKWNGSIPGNVDGSFSMDCYRDTVHASDIGWSTLPRGTSGFAIIARSGGVPSTVADRCEVWPIDVLSRSVPNMTSNTPVSATITCSIPFEPAEDAVVVT